MQVLMGAEVFMLCFAGTESVDFAYEDVDRPEVLRERINLTAHALRGPTRLITETARGLIVSAAIELEMEGVSRRPSSTHPLRRLKAFVHEARPSARSSNTQKSESDSSLSWPLTARRSVMSRYAA